MKIAPVLCLFLATLSLTAQSQNAQTPPVKFMTDLHMSVFECELMVSELAQMRRLYGMPTSEQRDKQTQCLASGRDKMKTAYFDYKASAPNASQLTAAKDLYAAYMSYLSAISGAKSDAQLRASDEATALTKALSYFRIETD